jgi:hypothetical protein
VVFRWFFVIAFLAIGATPVLAQQDGATIVGEVTDPSGGVVAGATVTVTTVATGSRASPWAARSWRT